MAVGSVAESRKSRAIAVLASAVLGAVLGAGVGAGGYWRESIEAGSTPDLSLRVRMVVTAVGGMAVGMAVYASRRWRGQGRLGHYLSWALAGIVGVGTMVLPDVGEAQWPGVWFILWVGSLCGLGIGLVARQIRGHWW